MADPATLRAQATELRTAATAMRKQAAALVQGVSDVQTHYPAGEKSVWGGPSADTFFGALATARKQLQNIEDDVNTYATACETKADSLDKQATAAASAPTPPGH